MITDAIIDFFFSVVGSLVDLLPDYTPPAWFSDVTDAMDVVFATGSSLGAWFPTSLTALVFGSLLAAWAVAFAIKIGRIVASFFTAGGGSAA